LFVSKQFKTLLFNKLKRILLERAIRKSLGNNHHRPRVLNLTEARSIGILYAWEPSGDNPEIVRLAEQLRQMGKKVNTLGFFNGKKLPANFTPTSISHIIIPNYLNWYQKALPDTAAGFRDNDYDILIDLSPQNCLPLKYIVTSCKSSFRVSEAGDSNVPVFDLMIKRDHSLPLSAFIDHIIHYLTILNNQNK
jgi:hypothetical protein